MRLRTTMLLALLLLIASSWPPVLRNSGHIFLAEEIGAIWYLEEGSLYLNEYEGEGLFLDAMVYTYRNDGGFEYLEKNFWHLDWAGSRYKLSATSSYDCEGNELGT